MSKKSLDTAGWIVIVFCLCAMVGIGTFLLGRQSSGQQRKVAGGKVRKVVDDDSEPGFQLPAPVEDAPEKSETPARPDDPEVDMRPAEIPMPDGVPAAVPPMPPPKAAPPEEADEGMYAKLGRGPAQELTIRLDGPAAGNTKKFRLREGSQLVWLFYPVSSDDEVTLVRLDGEEDISINLGKPVLKKDGRVVRGGVADIKLPGVYRMQLVALGGCVVRISQASYLEGQEGMPEIQSGVDVRIDQLLGNDIPGREKKKPKKARKK